MRYGIGNGLPQAAFQQQALTPGQVIRRYELARRQRLVRIIAISLAALSFLIIATTFFPTFDVISFVGTVLPLGGFLLALLVNRFNRPTFAGYLMITGIAAGAGAIIVARGLTQPHGLTSTDLRLYDFLMLPILLAGVLTQRRGPLLVGAVTIVFTAVSLYMLPRDAALQAYWNGTDPNTLGSVVDVFAIPIAFQLLTAIAAWLGADSVRRSLAGALRAEELALANQQIADQARLIEMQRRYLQDGIAHIQSVHTAFQRGNFDARAQVVEGELMPLAISLNALLDYLQRLMREQQQRERLFVSAHQLAQALRAARGGQPFSPPDYTGTPFDEVIMEVVAWQQGGNPARGVPGILSGPSQGNSGWSQSPTWQQGASGGSAYGSSPYGSGQLGSGPSGQSGGLAGGYQFGQGNPAPEPPASGTPGNDDPEAALPDWLRADRRQ
ncbi:MAG TPA: hypothetical protein VF807_06630 [Ktedonobacterales bacterium]